MGDLANLKKKILTYKLEGSYFGNCGNKRILLQVCGLAGHGKSSFINSIKYAMHGGNFSMPAPVAPANMSNGGFTMVRVPYELTDVISIVDNRGFGKSNSCEREEVYAQLANLQPLNEEKVKWDRSFEDRMMAVMSAKHNTNDLVVPIFVHSVQQQIYEYEKPELIEFFKTIQEITGFLPVIVLTKKLNANAKKMHQQFKEMAMETIFEVENYTEKHHVKSPEMDKTFLTILSAILDLVDFVAINVMPTLDTPQEEHRKRQQMLLKMAHDNHTEREVGKELDELGQNFQKIVKSSCLLL